MIHCLTGNNFGDRMATHGLSYKRSEGHHYQHATVNDIIHRLSVFPLYWSLPLYWSDGKHPDGVTIVPWERGKVLVWDFTCPDTFRNAHAHWGLLRPTGHGVPSEQFIIHSFTH